MVHLVGFTIEIYYNAQSYERQIYQNYSPHCLRTKTEIIK